MDRSRPRLERQIGWMTELARWFGEETHRCAQCSRETPAAETVVLESVTGRVCLDCRRAIRAGK